MSNATATIPTKARFDAYKDRILFGGVFGFGTLIVLALKSAGADPIYPLLIAVGAMGGYAAIVSLDRRFRLRQDRAGDSFYYMGLLFTLVSLAHTLYAFANNAHDSTDIISGFGIALGTTIVGLVLRVLVQQFRTDVGAIEYAARNELVETSNNLRNVLHSVILDMDTVRNQAMRVIDEGMKTAAETTSKAILASTERFTGQVDTLINRIETVFNKFSGNADELTAVSSRTVTALGNLVEKIEKIEPPTDIVQQVFGPARDGMREAADEIKSTARAQNAQLKRMQETVELSLKGLTLIDQKMKVIESTVDGFASLADTVRRFAGDAGQITSNLTALVASINASVAANERAALAIDDAAKKAGAEWGKAAAVAVEREREAAHLLASSTKSLVASMEAHVAELTAQTERARKASGQVVDGLAGMVEQVARQIA